jgi:hypothetical protein
MTILIEHIYHQTNDISPITQDEFSTQFCRSQHPSYLRSMKARQTEASTSVLINLMNSLHERAIICRSENNTHPTLTKAAARYDALANEVGEEIAKRSLKQTETSKWVREALVRIINSLNEDKSSKSYQAPPIIIC